MPTPAAYDPSIGEKPEDAEAIEDEHFDPAAKEFAPVLRTASVNSMSMRVSQLPEGTAKALKSLEIENDGDGKTVSVTADDLRKFGENKEKERKTNRHLRIIIFAMVGAMGMVIGANFGMSFWAISMVKDTEAIPSEAGMAFTAGDGKTIMQVAPATTSKLGLHHALVLDIDHLRTMDEIVYSYTKGGRNITMSDKVMAVEKSEGEDKSDVTVTIFTQTQKKVVISVEGPMLWIDGVEREICGRMKCTNFKVDDPDLDVEVLDKALENMFAVKNNLENGNTRRLWSACSGNARRRRQRRRSR